MIKEEGVPSLWNGAVSNMARSASLTCGQLATYDTIKEVLRFKFGLPDTLKTRVISSVTAATFATLIACPFDNMKIRMQKM